MKHTVMVLVVDHHRSCHANTTNFTRLLVVFFGIHTMLKRFSASCLMLSALRPSHVWARKEEDRFLWIDREREVWIRRRDLLNLL